MQVRDDADGPSESFSRAGVCVRALRIRLPVALDDATGLSACQKADDHDRQNSRLKARVNAGVDPKPALSVTNLIARSLWVSESGATRRRHCVRYCIGAMPVREIPTALASDSDDQLAPGRVHQRQPVTDVPVSEAGKPALLLRCRPSLTVV
jgi:hypothetical protein